MEDYKRVGKNLKWLRFRRGEKQINVARDLGFAGNSLSQYENGIRQITPDILAKFADYYGVTTDQIIKEDLSYTGFLMTASSGKGNYYFFDLYPLLYNEELMKNSDFANGYKKSINLINELCKGEIVKGEVITDIALHFASAAEETESILIVANLLCSIFFLWNQMYDVNKMLSINERMKHEKIDAKTIYSELHNFTESEIIKRNNFISDFNEMINDYIQMLKQDSELSELGDYYIALRYINGITECNEEFSLNMGAELMQFLAGIDNKYALNFYKIQNEANFTSFY